MTHKGAIDSVYLLSFCLSYDHTERHESLYMIHNTSQIKQ